MLNLKTKGIDNAAAVLGGYDALVQAGFPVETGKPQPRPAQAAASASSSSIKPPQQHGDEAATSAEPTTARAAKPAARAKRAVKRQKAKH